MVLWEKESGAGERRPEVLATADEREREQRNAIYTHKRRDESTRNTLRDARCYTTSTIHDDDRWIAMDKRCGRRVSVKYLKVAGRKRNNASTEEQAKATRGDGKKSEKRWKNRNQ
jgi:hypothetical protein